MQWSKDNKTNMRKSLTGFIKAGKLNETKQISCLTLKVTKYCNVQHCNRFACLNYLCSGQTFYKKVIMIVRLAATFLYRKMAIWKLNNIMINWQTNPQPSVLPNKWRFNISQDWEVLRDDFDSVSSETTPDATLQALNFHHSPLGYLEERAARFVDVTDKPKLVIEPEDNGQPITDSKDEKVRKELERTAKKKARRNNLYTLVRQALATGFAALLLSGPALLSCLFVLVLLSCPRLPTLSWSCLSMPAMSSRPPVPALSSYLPMPALLSPLILALLSFPMPALTSCSVLGQALTWFTFSALKTFKQALSDKLLGRQSTSPSPPELFYPFPILGPLPKKNNRKQSFDTTFINSRPLAANHTAKEVDLSFKECGCPA